MSVSKITGWAFANDVISMNKRRWKRMAVRV